MLQRVKEVQESDLRMVGALARNIQRVIAVTQADIDAAAAQGKAWVVKPVVKVSDPLDNLRGGTQLVIKQNSILPGQNVMRVMYIGGQAVVVGPGTSPLSLPDAAEDDILSLIAFGGTEQRNLPDNYLQRQFIYMMDGSYLLTDIVPTYDCKFEMDFQTTSVPATGGSYFGGRTADSPAGFNFGHNTLKKASFSAFSSSAYVSDYAFADNTRYKMAFDNKVFKLTSGGSIVATYTFSGTDANGGALAINGLNDKGSVIGNVEGIYLYSFKAWNGQGELVMNLVPAVQKGTVPVVGFYDTVSKTFKTATAGTFAAGGEAVPTPNTPIDIVSNNGVLKARHQSGLPLGYTALEYIESTGTQYIDLGRKVRSDYTYKIKVAWTRFGSYTFMSSKEYSDWQQGKYLGITYTDGTNKIWYSRGGTDTDYGTVKKFNATANTIYDIDWKPTSGHIDVNGTTYTNDPDSHQQTTAVFETVNNMYLFAANSGGTATGMDYVKLYSWQMYDTDGTTLLMNLVPAKNSSNVVGMYDLVNGVFYQNAGTGDFVAGSTVSDPVEIYTDGLQETIAIKDDQDATVSTAVAEMLLKVGDIADQQEIIDGTVTRKIGIKVLDGTEDWTMYNGGAYFNMSPYAANYTTVAYCSHYKYAGHGISIADMNNNEFAFGSTNHNVSFKSSQTTSTLSAWTSWLASQYAAGTPVIIIYPLATPTTESVTAQPMQTVEGDNTAVITQASLNNLELQVEYIEA